MRRNRGFLVLLSMCLTIVFIALNARLSTDLLASVAEKRSSFKKRHEGSHIDDRWIVRNQVKLYDID